MKKQAYIIHHTHWDPLWYFTKEDALVQFSHNFKETLKGFSENRIRHYFLDGQSYAIEQYLLQFPEDKAKVEQLIKTGKLFIGPFYNQIDAFITSGESIMQNLKIGIAIAEGLGGANLQAYLPDTFGHSADFPKIFNQFNIRDFIITRGVGDAYGLDNEFYFKSDDGSQVLCAVMLAGYGYGTAAFKEGTLFTTEAKDYNKIDVNSLIDRLIANSSLENSFVFPLGFDQNPPILDIAEKIAHYNASSDIRFTETTWDAYLKKVRKHAKDLKTHQGELNSTQYHRVHRTLFSSRSDIKTIQDKVERMLTYEVMPLSAMLFRYGLNNEQKLMERAWKLLHEGQTHASSTVSDTVNADIKARSLNAYNLAFALKHHMMKLIARSLPATENHHPLVIFSTHPETRTKHHKLTLYTKNKTFSITHEQTALPYTLLSSEKIDGNVKAAHLKNDPEKHFYKHELILPFTTHGMGYDTLDVEEKSTQQPDQPRPTENKIENAFYTIRFQEGLSLTDKSSNTTYDTCFYLEDGGDQGDNYDFDKPKNDWVLTDTFKDAEIATAFESKTINRLVLKGTFFVPKDLTERHNKQASAPLAYTITLETDNIANTIRVCGAIDNQAENHRIRLVIKGDRFNASSEAGTQFSVIKRPTEPEELEDWKAQGFFEAPVPVYPLLNFVSLKQEKTTLTAYTRSIKEYEVINKKDLALTVFRSVGHLGRPDLNCRPGRPSGLDNKIITTPDSQLLGRRTFDITLTYDQNDNPNHRHKSYTELATDALYHQNQPFEKTDPTITYFPINPLSPRPPHRLRHLHIAYLPMAYGTHYLSDKQEVMRFYNAGEDTLLLKTPFTHIVDGMDRKLGTLDTHPLLKPGELINLARNKF